jgi:citrate lyase alpha subunit
MNTTESPDNVLDEVAEAMGLGNSPRRRLTLEEQLREAIVNKQNEIENYRQVADLLAGDPDFAAKYEVLQDKLREL